jgi:hypothetical protein
LSTSDAEEAARTAPIELPAQPTSPPPEPPPSAPPAPPPPTEDGELASDEVPTAEAVAVAPIAQVAAPPTEDVVYVPLAVTIGDGFKFGCGFFLAAVLALLVGFVLLAALFLLSTLTGLNLPISR